MYFNKQSVKLLERKNASHYIKNKVYDYTLRKMIIYS